MKIETSAFKNGTKIPGKYAFAIPDAKEHAKLSNNLNPELSWKDFPTGTKSFALICHDPDVPSRGDDVNQEGKLVPAELPRVDFFHWVLIDIPVSVTSIPEGADSKEVTAKGKPAGKTPYGVRGKNSYTEWFAGDTSMGGDYCGYDGPCPPWNDSILYHYHFTIYALDVERLGLSGVFSGEDARKAMEGHILDKAEWIGTYSMNPSVS
ncbi:MAG: YbhB/YbcL family Raf kinase inhibitor-like protein [Leptospiraceae bacterium]|nr:YbhB/YbcL family Raf kinase inhibitor-like protein [Leptospiraceae bacterium]